MFRQKKHTHKQKGDGVLRRLRENIKGGVVAFSSVAKHASMPGMV